MMHEIFIRRCLQLAKMGEGYVAPNPLVGAVLVHDGVIIGEGYHQQYGQAHAEVNCLANVAENDSHKISSSTMYVSLEPCAHYGKTPPCANKLVEVGIKKVVIGCSDSFDKVNGKGIEFLKSNGVEVVFPVLESECRKINRHFFTSIEKQRPYVVLKWAQSADGFIAAKGEQTKITGLEADVWVHQLRAKYQGIIVGTNTALIDNPSLTVRHVGGSQPTRILLDKHLKIPPTSNLFDKTATTLILNTLKNGLLENVKHLRIDDAFTLADVLRALHEEKIHSVLIEGGAALLNSFLQASLWDEIIQITNPDLELGGDVVAPILPPSNEIQEFVLGKDIVKQIFSQKQLV